MIKLFRKIRRNLLTKKQFASKANAYFKYATGKIILVVLGILIALQLNNWNENKNKNDLASKYLAEMRFKAIYLC
jgi:hypothetical protein